MGRKRLLELGALALATALGPLPGSANLLGVDVDVNATVGLDDRTRALLDSLPTKLRQEAIRFIAEAQPKIDQSIVDYISRLQAASSQTIADAECAATSVAVQGSAEFWTQANPFKDNVNLVGDYLNRVEILPSRFEKTTSPERFLSAYSDAADAGYKTACAVRRTQEAHTLVMEYRALMQETARTWARARQEPCPDARRCLIVSKARVVKLAAQASPEDAGKVDAKKRLDAVAVPAEERFWTKFNVQEYESRLRTVYLIEDELAGAKKTRLDSIAANQMLADVKGQIAKFQTDVTTADNTFGKGLEKMRSARTALQGRQLDKVALMAKVNSAIGLDSSLSGQREVYYRNVDAANERASKTTQKLVAEVQRMDAENEAAARTRIQDKMTDDFLRKCKHCR